jgi:hypothetical protein
MLTNTDIELMRARIGEMEMEMARAAEVIGAQTLDMKSLSKGRRKILMELMERMCVVAEGGRPVPLKHYGSKSSPESVRERFPEIV